MTNFLMNLSVSYQWLTSACGMPKSIFTPLPRPGANGKAAKEFAAEEAETKIRELWGENIRNNGLRNANLRAAPDNDWTLIFNEKMI